MIHIAIPFNKYIWGFIPTALSDEERHEEIVKQVGEFKSCKWVRRCLEYGTVVYEVQL